MAHTDSGQVAQNVALSSTLSIKPASSASPRAPRRRSQVFVELLCGLHRLDVLLRVHHALLRLQKQSDHTQHLSDRKEAAKRAEANTLRMPTCTADNRRRATRAQSWIRSIAKSRTTEARTASRVARAALLSLSLSCALASHSRFITQLPCVPARRNERWSEEGGARRSNRQHCATMVGDDIAHAMVRHRRPENRQTTTLYTRHGHSRRAGARRGSARRPCRTRWPASARTGSPPAYASSTGCLHV